MPLAADWNREILAPMRFFNGLLATGLAVVVAWGPGAPAFAQAQPRPVAEMTDRIDRISRFSARSHEAGLRQMRTPRSAGFDASRRGGAVSERMRFGARDFHVRRNEVLGIDLEAHSLETAHRLGFDIIRTHALDALGIRVDVLRTPRGQSVQRALRRLRRADPGGVYEANSIFDPNGDTASHPLPAERIPQAAAPSASVAIIDSGLDPTAPDLVNTHVFLRNFGRGEASIPREHGAAIASLAARYGANVLFVADVFSGEPAYADAESLARGLDWIAGQEVAVINMSLAGPPNALLQIAVARTAAHGQVIVAAVGNQGRDSPPQYPAAYPEVIGVTAVDANRKVYERANRGDGVDVAALGVGLEIPGAKAEPLSGTSYAAPFVSAYLARRITIPGADMVGQARALIAAHAIDLGEPGFDPVYGAGLLADDGYLLASGADND